MSQYFCNNTLNTITVSDGYSVLEDRSNILAWLSPLDPKFRHHDIRGRRVEYVGEWLLHTHEYRSWYEGNGESEPENAVLFCDGDPGVGKTFISSIVIDRLCDCAREQSIAVACFYFDFAAQKEQSPVSVMGALLKQVVSGMVRVPEEIAQAYEDQKKVIGGRPPQLTDIVNMLQITSSEKPTFICIDALDECAPGNRIKLLDSLNEILLKSPGTRIFVTGRPQIGPEVKRRLYGKVTSLPISPMKGDVIGYLHSRLGEDTDPDAMDSILEADILDKIPQHFSEIFLLVSLNIDAILQEPTISLRRKKLGALIDGVGLEAAYGATLDRIKRQSGERARLGMGALMWISHSERPLKPDELCHALAVEIWSHDLDIGNVPSIGTLLACSQGLVAIDKETSTVRLIHFTVQLYILDNPELFGSPDSIMAETCLSYLGSKQVKSLSVSSYSNLQSIPFLEYSSLYWGLHANRELSDSAMSLALKLFDNYNNHVSTKILLEADELYTYNIDFGNLSLFSGLHCASFFGIVDIVATLVLTKGYDISQEDCVGNTPLIWGAQNGHTGVVNILLGQGDINPNKQGQFGQTPLSCAACNGHKGVVKMLLRRDDIDPDTPDGDGVTPLWAAAENGHEGVVKTLLGRDDVNPNKPNNDGLTPLSAAAWSGREGVVKMLLKRGGVDPDKPNYDGQTPLWGAAWSGQEGVVKILLGRDDVDPDTPDYSGQTPLSCAASNGHEGVVKMLLQRGDVDPGAPDHSGQTPLSYAAYNGHEAVMKILL